VCENEFVRCHNEARDHNCIYIKGSNKIKPVTDTNQTVNVNRIYTSPYEQTPKAHIQINHNN